MIDWKQVAETLCKRSLTLVHDDVPAYAAAIRLCELAAKLPPGEAERVLEAASNDELMERWPYLNLLEACRNNCDGHTLANIACASQDRVLKDEV